MHRPLCFAIATLVPLLALGACADDDGVEVGTGGAGGALTGVGGDGEGDVGAGDGGRDGVTSVTSTSGSRAQGTGGGETVDDGPYPIVLAHGFFGFEEFAGVDFVTYFHGVRDDLATMGEEVTTPAVDPFNDSTFRGAQLLAHVEQVLAQTGKSKVVIVGHSQGGLDAASWRTTARISSPPS